MIETEATTIHELKSVHWDIAKLLELGVSADFVCRLSTQEARELLKGLLYIVERQKDLHKEP